MDFIFIFYPIMFPTIYRHNIAFAKHFTHNTLFISTSLNGRQTLMHTFASAVSEKRGSPSYAVHLVIKTRSLLSFPPHFFLIYHWAFLCTSYISVLFLLYFLNKTLEMSTLCKDALYLTILKSVSPRFSQSFLTHFTDAKWWISLQFSWIGFKT